MCPCVYVCVHVFACVCARVHMRVCVQKNYNEIILMVKWRPSKQGKVQNKE